MPTTTTSLILLFLLLIALESSKIPQQSYASQRRIHISDDLDDVVDDEEDEAWREWGKKKSTPREFDPPPSDLHQMSPEQIQAEMVKRQFGPVFGFAKLRPGTRWTKEMVSEIALKWTKVARTGAIEAKFMAFDLGTIMVTMERGQDTLELKEFLLEQPEAYEIKIGEQLYRREGDPPFEEVIEKLRKEKGKADHSYFNKDDKYHEL